MTKLIFIFFVLSASLGHAGGALFLEGKIKSFDASMVEVDDGKKTYVIDKSKLPVHVLSSIKNLKPGAKTKLAIGFDAITSVKTSENLATSK